MCNKHRSRCNVSRRLLSMDTLRAYVFLSKCDVTDHTHPVAPFPTLESHLNLVLLGSLNAFRGGSTRAAQSQAPRLDDARAHLQTQLLAC